MGLLGWYQNRGRHKKSGYGGANDYGRGGGGYDSLPTTGTSLPRHGIFGFGGGGGGGGNWGNHGNGFIVPDGSANSIQLPNPVVKSWRQASSYVKFTYYFLIFFILLFYFGFRWLRYAHGTVWLTCHVHDCHLQVAVPNSWKPKINVALARSQFVEGRPVKTTSTGAFVRDITIADINEEEQKARAEHFGTEADRYKIVNTNANKSPKTQYGPASSGYKGPDADGNYLSYALILRDRKPGTEPPPPPPVAAAGEQNTPVELAEQDLSILYEILGDHVKIPKESAKTVPLPVPPLKETGENRTLEEIQQLQLQQQQQLQEEPPQLIRIVMKEFKANQSRRRVRTMLQKIDSYVRGRRQKVMIKETANPSWQGILMMVLGIFGFLLTCLLGQFWDDDEDDPRRKGARRAGPGIRRQEQRPLNSSSSSSSSQPKSQRSSADSNSAKYRTQSANLTHRARVTH